MKDLSVEKDPGREAVNDLKGTTGASTQTTRRRIETQEIEAAIANDWIDLTAPGEKYSIGTFTRCTKLRKKWSVFFEQMGFTRMTVLKLKVGL